MVLRIDDKSLLWLYVSPDAEDTQGAFGAAGSDAITGLGLRPEWRVTTLHEAAGAHTRQGCKQHAICDQETGYGRSRGGIDTHSSAAIRTVAAGVRKRPEQRFWADGSTRRALCGMRTLVGLHVAKPRWRRRWKTSLGAMDVRAS